MLKLKNAGKIRAIGISISDQRIDEANSHIEGQRVDVVQCVYNIFQQEPEYNLFPLAQKYNIGIVARSPFNSGALIGNWTKDTKFSETDWRGIWPKRMGFYNWLEECVEMTEHVKYAIREVMPLSSAALKYILMHPAVSSVIPGSANPTHVEKNIAVLSLPDLPLQVIESLKNLWVERKIRGTYNGSDSFGIFQGKK